MTRKQYLVDKKLQLGLAMRLFTYWTATWLVVFCVPILVRTFTSSLSFAQLAVSLLDDFWFPMLISAFAMPIVAYDCIRFSNKVAGPAFKLRRAIADLADNKEVNPVSFRKGDFCQELAADFNRLLTRIQTTGNNEQLG